MPLVTIYTTNKISNGPELLIGVSKIVAKELGKPESVMMAKLEDEAALCFGCNMDEPSALIEIEGIELPSEAAESLTPRLCQWAEEKLNTPQHRVFVKFTNVPRGMWGGNGKVY